MRLLVAIIVWVAAIAGAAEVSAVVAHSIKHNGSSSSSGSSVDPSSVTAADPSSLFHTANLERALTAAKSSLGADAQLDDFVIYPGYLSVTAVKNGTEIQFYDGVNGNVNTSTGGSPGSSKLFSLSQITADAPAAIAQRIATLAQVPESQLHYFIAGPDPISSKFGWLVYTVAGSSVEYFQTGGPTSPLFEYRTNSSTGLERLKG
jgi:hypothetical protein